MKEMLNAPNIKDSEDGTDERPLILSGDSVVGWELLLELQYDGYACILGLIVPFIMLYCAMQP